MSKVNFEAEEYMVTAMLEADNRMEAINMLFEAVPFLDDDPDMLELVDSTVQKLAQLSDADYEALDLTEYMPEEDDEDEM